MSFKRLLRQPGNRIRQGELLLAASTDKAKLNVESFADGYLREWLVQEGCATSTLTAIAVLTDTPTESYDFLSNGNEFVSWASISLAVDAREATSSTLAARSSSRKRARNKNNRRGVPGEAWTRLVSEMFPSSQENWGDRSSRRMDFRQGL